MPRKGQTDESKRQEKESVARAVLLANDLMERIEELARSTFLRMLAHIELGDLYRAREEFKGLDNGENRFVAKIAMQRIAVHIFGHKYYKVESNLPEIKDYLSNTVLEKFRVEILDITIDWGRRERGRVSRGAKPRIRFDNVKDENVQEAAKR
jgi:hypothetical protein